MSRLVSVTGGNDPATITFEQEIEGVTVRTTFANHPRRKAEAFKALNTIIADDGDYVMTLQTTRPIVAPVRKYLALKIPEPYAYHTKTRKYLPRVLYISVQSGDKLLLEMADEDIAPYVKKNPNFPGVHLLDLIMEHAHDVWVHKFDSGITIGQDQYKVQISSPDDRFFFKSISHRNINTEFRNPVLCVAAAMGPSISFKMRSMDDYNRFLNGFPKVAVEWIDNRRVSVRDSFLHVDDVFGFVTEIVKRDMEQSRYDRVQLLKSLYDKYMRPKYEGKREGLTIVRKEYETLAMHKVKSLNELISKYWPGVFVARDDGFILSTGTRLYGSCFTVHGFRGNVYYSMTFFPRMRSIGDDGEHKITDPDKEIGDVDMKCLFLSFTDDGYEAVRKDFGWTRLSLSYRDVIDMATGEFAAISAKINNQPLRELLAASPKDVPLVLTLI